MLPRIKKLFFLIGKSGRAKFFVLLVLMVVNSLLELAGVGSIPVFIIVISNPDMIMNHPWARPVISLLQISGSRDLMLWSCILLIALFVVKTLFQSPGLYQNTDHL